MGYEDYYAYLPFLQVLVVKITDVRVVYRAEKYCCRLLKGIIALALEEFGYTYWTLGQIHYARFR